MKFREIAMRNKLESRNICSKVIFVVIIILLSISCSGSKDFDKKPEPVGGEERVRDIFKQTLGPGYMGLVGKGRATFDIWINKNGVVREVLVKNYYGIEMNEYLNKLLVKSMKDKIKFTPATKNGEPVKANFKYTFYF
jgi:hypothetical protein